jgi:phosphotransferase system HPr (HPr) family protein
MKCFSYKTGIDHIHARPAVLLANEAKQFKSSIRLIKAGMTADAKDIMMLLNLNIKQGDEVKITLEGSDEEQAFVKMKDFFETQL